MCVFSRAHEGQSNRFRVVESDYEGARPRIQHCLRSDVNKVEVVVLAAIQCVNADINVNTKMVRSRETTPQQPSEY